MHENLSPLIINSEFYFECAGQCQGCFLTQNERSSKNNYGNIIEFPLLQLLKEKLSTQQYSEIIIGFGRGNTLNIDVNGLNKLKSIITNIEKIFNKYNIQKYKFEVSTSLIGKIKPMKEIATNLLEFNKNIYFNIVINSEISSNKFWSNYQEFYNHTEQIRINWGFTDNMGDILVININPQQLPDLNFLEKYVKTKKSPFNISLFPFSNNFNENDLNQLNQWSLEFINKFKNHDLNIKNFLTNLKNYTLDNIQDYLLYHKNNEAAYYFIDYNGKITNGSLSIMGEVDYPRLLEKFNLAPNIQKTLKIMAKNKSCSNCSYQKECLCTGAYLNLLSNYDINKDVSGCLSGYQNIFNHFSI